MRDHDAEPIGAVSLEGARPNPRRQPVRHPHRADAPPRLAPSKAMGVDIGGESEGRRAETLLEDPGLTWDWREPRTEPARAEAPLPDFVWALGRDLDARR